MHRKVYSGTFSEIEPRQIRVRCSTAAVDRADEIIDQEGIDLSQFKSNPIILWSHNPEHPVGTAVDIGLDAGDLCATIQFAPEGVSHKSDEVYRLVKAGVVKSVSIGFDDVESTPRPGYAGQKNPPQHFQKIVLYEISLVSIPCNPNAVVTAKARPDTAQPAPVAARKSALPWHRKGTSMLRIKDLYQVASLLRMLDELGYQIDRAKVETALEGDGSAAAEMLHGIMQDLGGAILGIAKEEIGEAIAAAAGAPTEAEMEPLDDQDTIYVMTGKTPAGQKFRLGTARARSIALLVKEGRIISAETAKCMKAMMDLHEEGMAHHRKAMSAHKKGMMALGDLMEKSEPGAEPDAADEDGDGRDVQTSDGTGDSEGSENDKGALARMTKAERLTYVGRLAA